MAIFWWGPPTLSNSKTEVELVTAQTEQLAGVKQSMAEQLNERKAQLTTLFDNANQYAEAIKRGELGIQQTEEEIHVVELKNKDIQRSIDIMEKELRIPTEIEEKINTVTKSLERKVIETERICNELESPSRVVFASGDDPTEEELKAKLSSLQRLVNTKKETLLAKEISAKELSLRIQQLEETSSNWKAATQSLLQDINECQGRVQERKRLRTSQMSELRMYDELIAARKSGIAELEKDISLRQQLAISLMGREVAQVGRKHLQRKRWKIQL